MSINTSTVIPDASKSTQEVPFSVELNGDCQKLLKTAMFKGMSVQEAADLCLKLPDHLRAMFLRSSELLSVEQASELTKVLCSYHDVFSMHDLDLGRFTGLKHTIETNETRPVTSGLRRCPVGFEGEEQKHLDGMLAAGVIQPSSSAWSSAPVLVRKKCGGVRWCIDYRKLNDVTVKDVYPLPLIQDGLDTLSGTEFFSTLDLSSGYWQIDLDEADRHKTSR